MNIKEPLTEKLLYFLADVADYGYRVRSYEGALYGRDDPKFAPHRRWLDKMLEDKEEKQKLAKALHSLKRSGYLQEKIFNGKRGLLITPKGRLKSVNLKTKNIKYKKLSNGQMIMVFFDVPESMRKNRNIFRSAIKQLGFEKMQRSVWVSEYDVNDELQELIKDCDLNKYAKALIVKEIK